MARVNRNVYKSRSNNHTNPNKNVCALKVAHALGADENVRYLHTIQDLVRAVRKTSYRYG